MRWARLPSLNRGQGSRVQRWQCRRFDARDTGKAGEPFVPHGVACDGRSGVAIRRGCPLACHLSCELGVLLRFRHLLRCLDADVVRRLRAREHPIARLPSEQVAAGFALLKPLARRDLNASFLVAKEEIDHLCGHGELQIRGVQGEDKPRGEHGPAGTADEHLAGVCQHLLVDSGRGSHDRSRLGGMQLKCPG